MTESLSGIIVFYAKKKNAGRNDVIRDNFLNVSVI